MPEEEGSTVATTNGTTDNRTAINERAIELLNRILEEELAGVVRYTHYSFMVFGHNRIPIVGWLRDQANESMLHAQEAGELITLLGGYPSLNIGSLLDSHRSDVGTILRQSLETESKALDLYRELLTVAKDRSVLLEEYARKQIMAEELHAGEVDKMLRGACFGFNANAASHSGANPASSYAPNAAAELRNRSRSWLSAVS